MFTWTSKKQPIVKLSTYEVEFVKMFTKSHNQIVKMFTMSLKFNDFRMLRMLLLQMKLKA